MPKGVFRRKVRKVRRNKKTTLKKMIRKEINKSEETKIYATFPSYNSGVAQNELYTMSPFQGLAQGTGDNARIGQTIFARHVKVRGWFRTKASNPVINVRVMVMLADEQYNALMDWTKTSTAGTGVAVNSLFYSASADGNAWNYNALIQNKAGNTILADKVYKVKSPYSVQVSQTPFDIDIPLFRRLTYTYASQLFNKQQLYILVTASSPLPSLVDGVSAITEMSIQSLVTYKDS